MTRVQLRLCALALGIAATLAPLSHPHADDYGLAIARAEALGRALYHNDRAAWIATDELRRRGVLAKATPVRGWVTEEVSGDVRVSFMGGPANAPKVYYQVDVRRGQLLTDSFAAYKSGEDPAAQTALMWKARTTALAGTTVPCQGNYNTVVLPARGDGARPDGFYVYLLWATTDPQMMNIGGHLRVETTADGARVVATKSFSNSCFSMPTTAANPPPGSVPVALYMTHVVAPIPEENHVFVSLVHKRELLVGTDENRTIWAVKDGRIAFVRQL